jgi:LacI family transcriptional regulator
MAIVSFDGSPESEYSWPALTTMRQPVREMAVDAIERLISPLDKPEFSRYSSELIVRQSCGCGFPVPS